MILNTSILKDPTKRTLLHIFGGLIVSVFFLIFFQLEGTPEWIRDNIQHVPTGQLIAYGVYFGICLGVFANRILAPPNRNIARSKQNYVLFGGRIMQDYSTIFIDFVTITIITFTFFQVGYDLGGDSVLFWATFCSLAVFPYLAFFCHWAMKNQKVEYTIPIFTNRI